jgi:hypothetical protein
MYCLDVNSVFALDGPRNPLFNRTPQELPLLAFRLEVEHWPIDVPDYVSKKYCLAKCPGLQSLYFFLYSCDFDMHVDGKMKPARKFCLCSPEIYLCEQCLAYHCSSPEYLANFLEQEKQFSIEAITRDEANE